MAITVPADDFSLLYPGLYHDAYRVAFRLLGSHGEAEDVAQDALARALDRWPTVARCDSPNAWVTRVAANRALDLGRRRRLATRLRFGPDEPREVDAERLDLQRALAALPRRQRQVVILRYLGDRSEAETAAVLGCSAGTVKQHASRGLAALRARLSLPLED